MLKSAGAETVSVVWSPDGALLATGLQKGCVTQTHYECAFLTRLTRWVRIWNVLAAEQSGFRGHAAEVTCVAFSPAGKHLATASADETLAIWDVATQEQVASFQSLWGELLTVAWCPTDHTQLESYEPGDSGSVLAISMCEQAAILKLV